MSSFVRSGPFGKSVEVIVSKCVLSQCKFGGERPGCDKDLCYRAVFVTHLEQFCFMVSTLHDFQSFYSALADDQQKLALFFGSAVTSQGKLILDIHTLHFWI